MSRRSDRRRRRDRRQRNERAQQAVLAPANDNVIRLRRRVVLHDRGGLTVEFEFGASLGPGRCDCSFVRATSVIVTHRPGKASPSSP